MNETPKSLHNKPIIIERFPISNNLHNESTIRWTMSWPTYVLPRNVASDTVKPNDTMVDTG